VIERGFAVIIIFLGVQPTPTLRSLPGGTTDGGEQAAFYTTRPFLKALHGSA